MHALLSILLMAVNHASPKQWDLAEEGKPLAVVVVPEQPSPAVTAAAEELVRYLEKICGAKLPVVSESGAGQRPRVDVGPTRRARSTLPPEFFQKPERIAVRSDADGLLICGGGDRGTRYAVYRFLEHLGCRWLAPGEENEVVPRRARLAVGPVHLDAEPAFAWRLFNGSRPELEDWGMKLGMNGFFSPESAATNGGAVYYPSACRGVHAYVQIMPPEKYFAAHPEWYPMIGGKRVPSEMAGRQLCVTASGLADEFAANVRRMFDEDPTCQVVSISPNDGYGWCECPACSELDGNLCGGRTTKQGLNSERPFLGDRVFWFANQVAGRVAEKHPGKQLLVLAYINYAEPPDTVRPLPNVVPFLCHYAPADYSRPMNDPSSEANRQFNDSLVRWVKVTPNVMLYSYVSKSQWWRLPRPVLRSFAADIQYLHTLGIRRYYCQSALSDWALDGPLYYVIARLLWDPAAEPQAVADEWIGQMFGPAASDMKAHYQAVEAAVRKTGKSYAGSPIREVPGLFDPALLDEALAALARAEKAAVEAPYRTRVAEAARVFRYGDAMVRAIQAGGEFAETSDLAGLDKVLALGRHALQHHRQADAAEWLQSWQERRESIRDIGVLAQGVGVAETKDGRTCYNTDETGRGDGANGWATVLIPLPDRSKPLTVEIDVWGESELSSIVVNTKADQWTRIRPQTRLSGKPHWETLVYRIPAESLDPGREVQRVGFGGGDSQIWIAAIRHRQE
ncbi:MAG: DUF4838 domain-containing protein [Pirellulales bacterium]|nr:DUF4838 domain-containing protein [Pirellulales bacterium]